VTQAKPLIIGVTGHRFLAEESKLRSAVREALRRLMVAFPGRALQVLSPLAEGADRLVAREVLRAPGATLIAVLPLPVEDYRQDFATPASRAAFTRLLKRGAQVLVLPAPATRNEAYEQVGRYVADHCDALIALWDGQGAQGQGGTAEVVGRARERGRPVFHVKTGNRKPGTQEATTLGEEQGKLEVYNPPSPRRAESL
jgi:hypothetical protein